MFRRIWGRGGITGSPVVAGGYVPENDTSALIFLKADTGISKDGSNNVSAWTDSSISYSHDFSSTLSLSSIRPVYFAGGPNSYGYVRCGNGISYYGAMGNPAYYSYTAKMMACSGFGNHIYNNAFSMYMVVRYYIDLPYSKYSCGFGKTGTTSSPNCYESLAAGGGTTAGGSGNSNPYYVLREAAIYTDALPRVSGNIWYLVTMRFTTDIKENIRYNGTQYRDYTTAKTPFLDLNYDAGIGGLPSGAPGGWLSGYYYRSSNIDIVEYIMRSGYDGTADVSLIETYFKNKFALWV